MTLRLMPLVCAALLVGTLPALAFDEDGFHSGMSYEDAAKVLVQRGEVPYDLFGGPQQRHRQTVASKPGAPSLRIGPSMEFCDGKLISYMHPLEDGVHSFARAVEKNTAAYGDGTARVHQLPVRARPFDMVGIVWNAGPDTTEVFMVQLEDDVIQVQQQFWSGKCPD